MKLGKLPPVASPFGEFKSYFTAPLPPPPPYAHWGHLVTAPWQMDGNGPDPQVTIAPATWPGCGDCVECGKVHALKLANYDTHHAIVLPTPDEVVEQYCAYQQCTPEQLFSDPTTYDQGEAITTSLLGWCKAPEYGTKLPFTAPIDHISQVDLANGIALGGGVLIGLQLPQNAMTEFPNRWTWTPSSPVIGGHCVWLTGYTASYVALVTWGALIQATWEFIMHTIDEAHAVVMPQMVSAGKTPSGLTLAKWEQDLAAA